MNISFQGNLRIDKSFYSLKQSNCKDIIESAQKLYDTPRLAKIIPDTTIYGKGCKTGDKVLIRMGKNWDIPIETRGEVTSGCVLHQILLNTCFYNGEQPLSSSGKYVMETIMKIIRKSEAK